MTDLKDGFAKDPSRADDKDVCLFCGEVAEERYYSGSYETYSYCRCTGQVRWSEAQLALQSAESIAKSRLELFQRQQESMDLEDRLARTRASVKRAQHELERAKRKVDEASR